MATKTWSSAQKGTYSGATAYTIGDFVVYNGSSYTCIANSTGNLPTDVTYWALVVSKGDTGATGATGTGIQGDAATIAVGTTTTIAAGLDATVANVGSSSAAVFNFGIPRGVDGTGTGDVVGPASSTAEAVAFFDGTTGKLLKGGSTTATPRFGAIGVGKGASASIRNEIKTDSTYTQGMRIEGDQVASRLGYSTFVTGNAYVSYTNGIDGKTEWGDGTSVCDTNLYRSAANTLKTDDSLEVAVKITTPQTINTNNAIAATANAATIPVTSKVNTVTNNSAATLTITLTTTNAVDGQLCMVRVLDASAVAQTITWVNTEVGEATPAATSNGSTTLPRANAFCFNSATTKWRCIA